jgi:5-methylcytosine-specific restriction enzyme subunit McrC
VHELRAGLAFETTSFVGRIDFGAIQVTVLPKIRGLPLLDLVRYGYDLRRLDLFPGVQYEVADLSFADLLIVQLAAEVAELFSRGLARRYIRQADDLSVLKGAVDMPRLAGAVVARRPVLPCIHHPRLEDSLLNQILLAGLRLGATLASDLHLRATLRRSTAL